MDLVLNNLQRLICHKTHQTKPNQREELLETARRKSGKRERERVLWKGDKNIYIYIVL